MNDNVRSSMCEGQTLTMYVVMALSLSDTVDISSTLERISKKFLGRKQNELLEVL